FEVPAGSSAAKEAVLRTQCDAGDGRRNGRRRHLLVLATATAVVLAAAYAARAGPSSTPSCAPRAAGSEAGGWQSFVADLEAYLGCGRVPSGQVAGAPPRAVVGRVPDVLPTRKRIVALTFDAGGDDSGLPRIYRTLLRLRATGTFFMTGHFASYYPGWARRLGAHFPVCNHTMNHLALVGLSDADVRAEVTSARRAIR